jgi:hypothetical protein
MLWKYRSKKIAATNRASPLPQIALHGYWKTNFSVVPSKEGHLNLIPHALIFVSGG